MDAGDPPDGRREVVDEGEGVFWISAVGALRGNGEREGREDVQGEVDVWVYGEVVDHGEGWERVRRRRRLKRDGGGAGGQVDRVMV